MNNSKLLENVARYVIVFIFEKKIILCSSEFQEWIEDKSQQIVLQVLAGHVRSLVPIVQKRQEFAVCHFHNLELIQVSVI